MSKIKWLYEEDHPECDAVGKTLVDFLESPIE